MNNILRLDHVVDYNSLFGQETFHPLVSVIDFSACNPVNHGQLYFGFYAIFLKDVKCGDLRYGKQYYDYQEGTLIFIGPGQVVGVENSGAYFQPKGWALLFHPDLIHGTSLGKDIHSYSFFSYEWREALHVSERERKVVLDCISKIDFEIRQGIDKHSKRLIVNNIELFLNYCIRFYDRQFITREVVNKSIIEQFEALLGDYLHSEKLQSLGLPYVGYFAEKLNLSANYFGDLIKKETGRSAQEYIQMQLVNLAKEKIFDTSKSVSEIAFEMGFRYPQHFTRFFKQHVGSTPNEFRNSA